MKNGFDTELASKYIALSSIKGVGDASIYSLFSHFGSLNEIFEKSKSELKEANISENILSAILSKEYDQAFVENELSLMEENNITLITLEDERYPALLKEIYSPPPFFYAVGDISCLKNICIGIVGSRKCSKVASSFTQKLSADLASYGLTVVSGFAYGIDIAAHLGAASKGATVAVLGSGLLNIYPEKHISHIEAILSKGGLLLSEFSLLEKPTPASFPRRNRVIAGLSKALCVIEANTKSGSLITVRHAIEQNRELFAVPTFPTSFNNATNSLLRDGAKLLEGAEDILRELKPELISMLEIDEKQEGVLSLIEDDFSRRLVSHLLIEPLTINDLCLKLNTSIIEVMNTLSELEIMGIVEKGNGEAFNVVVK